jgi:hypothetical protein
MGGGNAQKGEIINNGGFGSLDVADSDWLEHRAFPVKKNCGIICICTRPAQLEKVIGSIFPFSAS